MEEISKSEVGTNDNSERYNYGEQVPNATAILVLGICSIVGCILYGLPGLICGIIAIVLHGKAKEVYMTNEPKYEMSYKNAKAGYICAIIGTSISALYLLMVIGMLIFMFFGIVATH